MKQILQDLKQGDTVVENVPVPLVRPGRLLIRTRRSLVSAGTERMLVEFGQASLLDKARQQPDKVRQVLDKLRTDGLGTHDAVRRRQARPADAARLLQRRRGGRGRRRRHAFPGRRPGGLERPARRVRVRPENLCATIPDRRGRRGGLLHGGRRDRPAGHPARAADARRDRGGHRPRPDRPAGRAAAACQRLPGAGHRLRSAPRGARAQLRRRDRVPVGGRGSRWRPPAGVSARPWRRRGDHHGLHGEQRAGAPGRADVPQARAHRARRRHRAASCRARISTRRS